jgi:hypothetical protein
MKINIGKLLRVVGRVIVAAPVIIEAVKPVLRKRSKPKVASGNEADTRHGAASGPGVKTDRL